MSLVEHLLETRSPLDLAKLAAATAKENAALKDRVHELEHELFWMKVAERNDQLEKAS